MMCCSLINKIVNFKLLCYKEKHFGTCYKNMLSFFIPYLEHKTLYTVHITVRWCIKIIKNCESNCLILPDDDTAIVKRTKLAMLSKWEGWHYSLPCSNTSWWHVCNAVIWCGVSSSCWPHVSEEACVCPTCAVGSCHVIGES